MIWESSYWKDLLLRHARDLERRLEQRRWPDRSLAKLEQTVMLGAYSVRKLLDAKKLTVDVEDFRVFLVSYPCVLKRVTMMNAHKIDRHYDLASPRIVEKEARSLCNLLVHSYVFVPTFDEVGRFHGVLFNSDRTRHEALFLLVAGDLIELFEAVGHDEASYVEYGRMNRKKRDWDLRLRTAPPRL